MRTRGWALGQDAMGAEAAAKVAEAGSLARRHGHARVTPLHVASALLSSSSSMQAAGGLLRLSGHPLRHEDLKVSFSDALSRLPVACPVGADPLDLSNALVALLRRAQTVQHQGPARGGRRGKRRRRKVAAVKIELEQLVASVLDDPSVHRAMCRAASGSQVKPNVVERSSQARAGAGTPSAGTVREVLHWPVAADDTCLSRDHASKPRTGEGLPAFVGQCGVTTDSERTSLPCHQDAILTCRNTSLQPKFAELSATNFKIMCEELELRVPRHHDIIPDIACTVLLCRSGMMRRAGSLTLSTTWLLFQGNDYYGKKAMAQELSKLIFGSYTEFFLVNSVDHGNLALKTESSGDSDKMFVMRTLLEAIRENPHRVVFIHGLNQLDHESEIEIKNLIATGRTIGCNGSDMVNLEDAIVVLSSGEAFRSKTFAFSPLVNRGITNAQDVKEDTTKEKELESSPFSLDLNACAEDVEGNTVDNNAGIMRVVDGVFRFD